MKKIAGIFAVVLLVHAVSVQADGSVAQSMDTDTDYTMLKWTSGNIEWITVSDIYELNEKYAEHKIKNSKEAVEFLEEKGVWILAEMNKTSELGGRKEFIVKGEYEYTGDYYCHNIDNKSEFGITDYPILEFPLTGETIQINGDKKAVEEFVNQTCKKAEEAQEAWKNVTAVLSEEDYGGIYYDLEDKKIHIWLKNIELQPKLEALGYICDKTVYSYEELQKELRQIWNRREELDINYIQLYEHYNALNIVGNLPEKEFFEKLDTDFTNIVYYQGTYFIDNISNMECKNYMEIQSLEEFIDQCRKWMQWWNVNENEEYWARITEAMEVLKKNYPDYTYQQLFYHIASDGNYKRYIDFDKELLDFVNTLPVYEVNNNNPIEEMEFGDSERIELKSQLREYKVLYPEMKYSEIYNTYLEDWENIFLYSRKEKLYCLIFERRKEELRKEAVTSENDSETVQDKSYFIIVTAGVGILLLGVCWMKWGIR